MPRGDRTGPMGQGPMTGRGAGYCAGYGVPGYANPWVGGGLWGHGGRGGWGRGGWGRGWRHGYYATGAPGWAGVGSIPYPPPPYAPVYGGAPPEMTREGEVAGLKEQSEYLEQALEDVRKRLTELESGSQE